MRVDNRTIEIDQLKKNIFSDDWELIKTSAQRLSQIGGDDVVDFLISCLESDQSGIRNRSALALFSLKNNRALGPLLKAIFKKENYNYNGTMVFALENLDCSRKLKEIFRILFYQTYESKASAYSILLDQTFEFTKADLSEVQEMWKDCIQHPEKCPLYNDAEVRAMMKDAVNKYMVYLEPIRHRPALKKKRTTSVIWLQNKLRNKS